MEFATVYNHPDSRNFRSLTGSPIHKTYSGYYDVNGRVVVAETGQENLYEYIQSFKDSVDINTLIARYKAGDVSAFSKAQGLYMDVTQYPSTFAESLNNIEILRTAFNRLPVETRAKFNHSFTEFLAASYDADFVQRVVPNTSDNSIEKNVVEEVSAVES